LAEDLRDIGFHIIAGKTIIAEDNTQRFVGSQLFDKFYIDACFKQAISASSSTK
jgi:hypothetical protein